MPKRKPAELSHVAADGSISMVDVGSKPVSQREAVAEGVVRMSVATAKLLAKKALPKGDVLATAKVAGILAAKQTSSLIPLTHPIPLDYVDVRFDVSEKAGEVTVTATARCSGRTGVEIEAMTACAVASLTIYDMCKSAEKGIVIERIRLLRKSGGKSGEYVRA
ncbi:MAG: cyclic pyranopterin monophosphate synthase MoaC [Thermoanaerobaculia bacterium]|nr:cyclic pyranopterin monophosphate synthase MoaC [Thermoanaerobaculia bacterium]